MLLSLASTLLNFVSFSRTIHLTRLLCPLLLSVDNAVSNVLTTHKLACRLGYVSFLSLNFVLNKIILL